MRYSMLVTITNMAKTLLEAAQYLASAPAGDMRTELLDNGRQMIGQIKSVLERHSGDLRTTLPLERLWKIEQLWGGEDTAALEATLTELIRKMPEEIFYQVRAVFFAELGEKWDAMESVYEYMRDDPRFDPVVVRTPVGRMVTRDGKREQEIIYRDFLTPMGIPSLGYDQYSLEEDCPELAFISQPYESCTLQEFWPETIAKVTRLVYLPYFLQDVFDNDDIAPLAKMPVYRYAWKVACPNRNQFEFYCKYAANGGANAILTGIPKTDLLAALREQGTALPSEWCLIQGKTVFLWNTWYSLSISSLRFFDQIIGWFKTHPDCALIWRAHPMTDIVTKLHTPEQYPHFLKMKELAQETQNVVLDSNTSFHAAFYYSDAMISDYSSMIAQYLLMDKPAIWIKSPLDRYVGAKYFIENQWLEQTYTSGGVLDFLEQTCKGEDPRAELRKQIRQRDLPLADGHCAERICDTIWAAMHGEDGMVTEKREISP